MSTETLRSPEFALDRKIEALLRVLAELDPESDGAEAQKAIMIGKLQELFAERSRLMRPPPPSPPPRKQREFA